MKHNPTIFRAICEILTKDPRFFKACERVKIRESTGYRWLLRSKAQVDPAFQFVWLDAAPIWFHEGVVRGQAVYHNSLIQSVEHFALYGRTRETRFKGRTVYKTNPEYDLLTNEQLLERGIETRYLRDPITMDFIPEVEHVDAPVQLQLAVLQARAPRIYSTKVSHSHEVTRNLGVTIIQPPKIPPPALPSPDVVDGEFTEAKPRVDFLDDEPPQPPMGFKIV
jgi:hypothetical protein